MVEKKQRCPLRQRRTVRPAKPRRLDRRAGMAFDPVDARDHSDQPRRLRITEKRGSSPDCLPVRPGKRMGMDLDQRTGRRCGRQEARLRLCHRIRKGKLVHAALQRRWNADPTIF